GFPGFIGKRLVAELLADSTTITIACLVEPRMEDAARKAAAELDGGDRVEIIPGDITDRRLGLSDDDYERLTAETKAVFHPAAIYRPAIVVGDSQSGLTQKFDGPYFMLRAMAVSLKRNMPIAKYGKSAAPFNVVPVDFVVNGLMAGSKDEKAIGETFHLVDPE